MYCKVAVAIPAISLLHSQYTCSFFSEHWFAEHSFLENQHSEKLMNFQYVTVINEITNEVTWAHTHQNLISSWEIHARCAEPQSSRENVVDPRGIPAQFTKLTVPPQRYENDARSCATFSTFADKISVQKTYSKTRQQGACQCFNTSVFVRVCGCIACSHFVGVIILAFTCLCGDTN